MKSKYSYLKQPTPHLLAHRGGDVLGKDQQNTLAAFKSAVNLGYKYIETDVVLSKDGKVVIYHGSKSRHEQRKTGQHRRKTMQSMTYEEIKHFFKPYGVDVPLLEEALQELPNTFFNIDAKTKEVIAPLARVIKKTRSIDRICIASFKYSHTLGVAELLGGQKKVCTSIGPMGFSAYLLHSKVKGAFKSKIRSLEVGCLQVPYRFTSKDLIRAAHDNGVMVHAWTVNEESKMRKLLALGVDGIVSDKVKTLISVDNSSNLRVI